MAVSGRLGAATDIGVGAATVIAQPNAERDLAPVVTRASCANSLADKKSQAMEFTDERKAEIKAAFEAHPALADGRLEFAEVHKLLFTAEERGEYGRKDFEDDVLGSASDDVKEKQTMSWEDVTKFLEDNL